ncbi:hypothetical protein OF83DRAFT_1169342 [Amylostereum chailletii]|nr:hypothetical protein OF83DRAFT_1169342 [Amylostereum chailletii]
MDLCTRIQSLFFRYFLKIPIIAAALASTYMGFFGQSDRPVETFFCPRPVLLPRDKVTSPPDSHEEYFSDLIKRRLSSVFSASAGYKGVWWLPGPNAQTIYTSIGDFSKDDPVEYARTYIRVSDGGTLALDVTPSLHSSPRKEGEPVLIVAHGLTGGSHEAYVIRKNLPY